MDKSPDAFRTISEVAEFLETPAHVLRFWESRFPQIKPVKRAGGRRYYRPADVALLAGIRQLLHQDGMTIRGVQKILRDQGVRHVINLSDPSFSEPLGLEADAEDIELAEIPTAAAPDANEANNIVSLTEWRPSADAVDLAAQPDALDLQAAPNLLETSTDLSAAAPIGASLAAQAEDIVPSGAARAPLGTEELPLQWSLFDLDSGPLPPDDGQHDPALSILTDGLAEPPPAMSSDASLGLANLVASPDLPVDANERAHSSSASPAVPSAEPMGQDHPALFEAERPEISPAITSAPESAEETVPVFDRPWLPPRLRALQAKVKSEPQTGLPQAELMASLERARTLLDRLKASPQFPHG